MTSRSRTLRSVQRSPLFILGLFAIAAGFVALAWAPFSHPVVNVSPLDVASAFGAVLTVNLLAALVFHTLGDRSPLYLTLAFIETPLLQIALMWLIYRGRHGDSFFWFVYFVQVSLNSGITEYRRYLLTIYVAAPIGLAVAFLVGGMPSAAIFTLIGAGLGALIFIAGMRTSLRLEAAIAERESIAAQLADLKLTEERERIARDLHDGVAADLTGLLWRSQRVADSAKDTDTAEELRGIAERANHGLDELRTVVWALRTEGRTFGELTAYVRQRVAELRTGTAAVRVSADVDDSPEPLSSEVCMHLLRSAQEAVRNAARHACASEIHLRLELGPPLRLLVEDDGVGVDPALIDQARGGLHSFRARAARLGGSATVTRLERGTRVEILVPRRDEGGAHV